MKGSPDVSVGECVSQPLRSNGSANTKQDISICFAKHISMYFRNMWKYYRNIWKYFVVRISALCVAIERNIYESRNA
ncbi:MAG: hypothetical protein A3J67_03980 [Parcubacteria group bacterium RIFCSPHIGHO2_02_FULL_48_10b]|nr:MAG: hypothetical protein A3J67_03980 [Parcubacteria group bacterium RIFCSPHIGHO2_02_FULL_48_10b]